MFGYVLPLKPYLYLKDDTLYNAIYCGVCAGLKSETGNFSRLTLTYDMAFMSALAHNITGVDLVIKRKHCIAHPLKKRPIAQVDEITEKLACFNVVLAYYKILDDIYDEKKGGFKSAVFKSSYKKAVKKLPIADKIVKKCFNKLSQLEKQNSDSIDIVANCFANMLVEFSEVVLGDFSTESTKNLMYAVGKWIYLIDALDDYDKDVKKKNFNVFYNAYKYSNAKELISEHGEDITFTFGGLFSIINENYKNIKMHFNSDLTDNILLRGLPDKTRQILNKGNKNNE